MPDDRIARRRGDSIASRLIAAIKSAEGTALTATDTEIGWRDLETRMSNIDGALRGAGIDEEVTIAMPGRNSVVAATACIALIASRRCAAIINPFQPTSAMIAAATRCHAAALFLEESDLENCELSEQDNVFVIGKSGSVWRHRSGPGRSVRAMCGHRLILSTSGTTGHPKQIAIRDETLSRAMDEIILFNRGFGDRQSANGRWPALIQYSPLAHIGGALTLVRGITQGRQVNLVEKFDAHGWADLVAELKPTTTGLPPTMMRMLLDADIAVSALRSLSSVWSGSAPVRDDVVRLFTDRYGLPVLGNYGATEYCGAVATWSLDDYHAHRESKPNATGRILSSVANARVRSQDDGRLCSYGETGLLELQVHRIGPEWLSTNDLAHLDAEGFLYLRGRADDAIVRGGFKLAPERIANALRGHPAVRDAAVIGIADDRLGAVPVAAVEMSAGAADIQEAHLIAFVKARLPAYFAPVRISIVDELPRTPSMKIDRGALRLLFE